MKKNLWQNSGTGAGSFLYLKCRHVAHNLQGDSGRLVLVQRHHLKLCLEKRLWFKALYFSVFYLCLIHLQGKGAGSAFYFVSRWCLFHQIVGFFCLLWKQWCLLGIPRCNAACPGFAVLFSWALKIWLVCCKGDPTCEMMKEFQVSWCFSVSSACVYNLLIMLQTVVQQIFWWAAMGVGEILSLLLLAGRCVSPVCPPLSTGGDPFGTLYCHMHVCSRLA